MPVWLVLLNLKLNATASQRELAAAMGIREATLTHHLNSMETAGLLTRRRDPANRRIHLVELTKPGEDLFLSLRAAAVAFDRKLRRGLTEQDAADLDRLLGRLAANVAGDATVGVISDATPGEAAGATAGEAVLPWAGLAEEKP